MTFPPQRGLWVLVLSLSACAALAAERVSVSTQPAATPLATAPATAPVQAKLTPSNPNATSEAAALLKFIQSLGGSHVLTGQHNYPNTKDRNTQFAARYTGKMPVIYSQDMGHAKEGDSDSYLARPDIMKECIRQHQLGAIVTLCWHAVPPTADEPITFRAPPGATPEKLLSVQGQLLDQQFKDVLTPGTPLYERWCRQVDVIAGFLKQLQDAKVPVLWRPYHEMNGSWFWWGGRTGETKKLYVRMYDRFTKVHKLNNLVWCWSVDRVTKPEMAFANYFPGEDYVDVLTLDVYGSDFQKSYYDDLLALAKGKPIALGEVGNPPTLEVLGSQPKWSYWVTWAGMVRNTTRKQYMIYANDPRILFLGDPAYTQVAAAYRSACGLPAIEVADKAPAGKIDLSGTWLYNEDKSVLDSRGFASHADDMEIVQIGNELRMKRRFINEYADDRITDESYSVDGKEMRSEMFGSPRVTTAALSAKANALLLKSVVTMNRGGRTTEMTTTERWTMLDGGKSLLIVQTSTSPRGERKLLLVYDRKE